AKQHITVSRPGLNQDAELIMPREIPQRHLFDDLRRWNGATFGLPLRDRLDLFFLPAPPPIGFVEVSLLNEVLHQSGGRYIVASMQRALPPASSMVGNERGKSRACCSISSCCRAVSAF